MKEPLASRPLPDLAFLVVANAALALAWHANPYPSGLPFWSDKIGDLLAFEMPRSNFYPPGAALLTAPFAAIGVHPLAITFFYFNIGAVFYALLCRRAAGSARVLGLVFLPCNIYFFWLLKSTHDVVFEWALLMPTLYWAVAARPLPFAAAAAVCSLVRPTDAVACLVLALWMARAGGTRTWLLTPAFLAALALVNHLTYGSPAPALNGGYNIRIGNDPAYEVGHPRFDIDGFFEAENNPRTAVERRADGTPRPEAEVDAALRARGLADLASEPARSAYAVVMKAHLWLFNFEKVPNLSRKAHLAADRRSIVLAGGQGAASYLGAVAYMLYKLPYNLLLMSALAVLLASPRATAAGRPVLLLLPLFATLPVAALTFPDTRFKIVYEVAALPGALGILSRHLARRAAARDAG